jgi:competence protein ComEC
MGSLYVFLAAGVVVLTFFISIVPLPGEKVVFLDVGQGDSILLQDNTQQILIDGGPGMAVLAKLAEEMPWFDSTIEVVVATHPDRDHLEGLLHVLERYKVGLVMLPRFSHDSQLQREWLRQLQELLRQKDITYRFAYGGQRVQAGDISVNVVWPNRVLDGGVAAITKSNNASVVSRVDFHEMSFLLTADIESSIERVLVRSEAASKLDVDVLKVGHHGSQT